MVEALRAGLEETAATGGFEERLLVKADERIGPTDCRIEWGEGGAERNSVTLWESIKAIVARSLGPGYAHRGCRTDGCNERACLEAAARGGHHGAGPQIWTLRNCNLMTAATMQRPSWTIIRSRSSRMFPSGHVPLPTLRPYTTFRFRSRPYSANRPCVVN